MTVKTKSKPATQPAEPTDEQAAIERIIERIENELTAVRQQLVAAEDSFCLASLHVEERTPGADAMLAQASNHRDSLVIREASLMSAGKAAEQKLKVLLDARRVREKAEAEEKVKGLLIELADNMKAFDDAMATPTAIGRRCLELDKQIRVVAPWFDTNLDTAFGVWADCMFRRFQGFPHGKLVNGFHKVGDMNWSDHATVIAFYPDPRR